MKLRREASTPKGKAIASLKRSFEAFNRFQHEGRVTSVRLPARHACEMLLKSTLVQRGVSIFGLLRVTWWPVDM